MLRLGVNIDHVATVRQARRGRSPEPIAAAHAAVIGGADRITMHLREDRRHIQDRDVTLIKEALQVPINFEMAVTDEMVAFAGDLQPEEVLLVQEKREELTTEGGLDVEKHSDRIAAAVETLGARGIPVSLFIEPDEATLVAASGVGARAVELHTGAYAAATQEGERMRQFLALRKAATTAKQLGLRVHAGHGLDYANVARIAAIPEVEELNIGFSIVSRALFIGMTDAVREMKALLTSAREGIALAEATP